MNIQVYAGKQKHRYFQKLLPPRVADSKKWVPYFLIRFSVICWRVGRRPKSLMLRKNSGARGNGEPRKFLLSTARLFTFQRPNSLKSKFVFIHNWTIWLFPFENFIWEFSWCLYITMTVTCINVSGALGRRGNIYNSLNWNWNQFRVKIRYLNWINSTEIFSQWHAYTQTIFPFEKIVCSTKKNKNNKN